MGSPRDTKRAQRVSDFLMTANSSEAERSTLVCAASSMGFHDSSRTSVSSVSRRPFSSASMYTLHASPVDGKLWWYVMTRGNTGLLKYRGGVLSGEDLMRANEEASSKTPSTHLRCLVKTDEMTPWNAVRAAALAASRAAAAARAASSSASRPPMPPRSSRSLNIFS